MAAISRLTVRLDRMRLLGSPLSALRPPSDGDEEGTSSSMDMRMYATCGTSNTAGASGNAKKGKVRSFVGNASAADLGDLFEFEVDSEELTHRFVTISLWCASLDDGLGDDPVFEVRRTCTVALWTDDSVLLWAGGHAAVIEIESAYGTYSGEFPLHPAEGVIELTCSFTPTERGEDASASPMSHDESAAQTLTTKQLRTHPLVRGLTRPLAVASAHRAEPTCACHAMCAMRRTGAAAATRESAALAPVAAAQDGRRTGYKCSRWTGSCPTSKSRTWSSPRSSLPLSAAHSRRRAPTAGCAPPPLLAYPPLTPASHAHTAGCGGADSPRRLRWHCSFGSAVAGVPYESFGTAALNAAVEGIPAE